MAKTAAETVGPWLDDREQAAWRGLLRMHAQLTAELNRDLSAESGLSLQDYAVLVALTDEPDGRRRAFDLGRDLGWEKSRLSHYIARMAERELVDRQRCPSDQRGWFIVITRRGRRAIEEAAPGHAAAVRRLFADRLTAAQLSALTNISERVVKGLSEPAPRPGSVSVTAGRSTDGS